MRRPTEVTISAEVYDPWGSANDVWLAWFMDRVEEAGGEVISVEVHAEEV